MTSSLWPLIALGRAVVVCAALVVVCLLWCGVFVRLRLDRLRLRVLIKEEKRRGACNVLQLHLQSSLFRSVGVFVLCCFVCLRCACTQCAGVLVSPVSLP